MGKIAVIDLFETTKDEIIAAGHDLQKAKEFASSFNSRRVKAKQVDVSNIQKTAAVLKGANVAINCVQYQFNLHVMRACLKANAHYVDLGGLFHMTLKQLKLDSAFKKKNLTAILGCGATPGITNVLAAYGAEFFDTIKSIHVQFADADYTKYDLPFVVPYSPLTIIEEFSKRPAVFQNGKMRFVQPLSGREIISFPKPVGKVSCFYTLHSEVATFPISFKNKGIKNCSFRGGFDDSLLVPIKNIMDSSASVKDAVRILNQFLPTKQLKYDDVELLRVEITGKKNGRKKKTAFYCKSKTNKKWNIAAGSWNTGTPPSIAAQMIANGIITKRGVLPPERCVPPQKFFKELAKRNMRAFKR